jgi:hypothetical protein
MRNAMMSIAARWSGHWAVVDVIVPALFSRLALLLIGLVSFYIQPWLYFPLADVKSRGWIITPHPILDMWFRWDSVWYLDIIKHGYIAPINFTSVESNISFYPLFPYLIKLLVNLFPVALRRTSMTVLIGVILSNVCLILALFLLYKLTASLLNNTEAAGRTMFLSIQFLYGIPVSGLIPGSYLCGC